MKHKYAGWRGRAPANVDQHDVAIVEGRHHAVAFHVPLLDKRLAMAGTRFSAILNDIAKEKD